MTESQAKDAEEMAKLAERGITPVVVPDDDPDHNPAAGKEDDLDQLERDCRLNRKPASGVHPGRHGQVRGTTAHGLSNG